MTSRTGLIPSIKKNMQYEYLQPTTLEFTNLSVPAPYVLRPFAGVYNPFPYGCSILCNHPADYEAKDVVKKAKDTWATEGKALLTLEEMETIRSHYNQTRHGGRHSQDLCEDTVPEELFRRYTDTDSRPLTPAPTLASVITKGSQVRRCVTPDPISSLPTRERTLLVLDLRRSHSQETLSWQGQGDTSNVLHPTARTPSRATSSPSSALSRKRRGPGKKRGPMTTPTQTIITVETPGSAEKDKETSQKLQMQVLHSVKGLTVPDVSSAGKLESPAESVLGSTTGEQDGVVKRRGKKKRGKKSNREATKEGEKEFQGIPDPGETQVSTLGNESRAGSNRPSLVPGTNHGEAQTDPQLSTQEGRLSHAVKLSFLDADILKQLQRQLDQEVVDAEFDPKRKRALEEALRARPLLKHHQGEELKKLKKELRLPPNNPEKWLTIPRVFTRQSARFELPMDSRRLNNISPIEYIQNFVFASTERRVLYNHVFNLHREEFEDDEVEPERRLLGQNVVTALGEIMGRQMKPEEAEQFQVLVGWKNEEELDFRTFVGLGALCERLLGPKFCSKMPTHSEDPRYEVEQADFESLDRKLLYLNPNPRVVQILKGIRDT